MPSTWLFLTRSEPARSTTFSRARVHSILRAVALIASPAEAGDDLAPACDGDLEDGMAPARRLVHAGLSVHQVTPRPPECIQQNLGLCALHPSEPRYNAAILHTQCQANTGIAV
eukprot:SRR837773.12921.p1 GENE.SRR837773.12921~~SRR837773.12921.p1  ORF type:complete len:114 (+),score=2.37 SRR837773.12921:89-430(+)